jgi:hypothetical protein
LLQAILLIAMLAYEKQMAIQQSSFNDLTPYDRLCNLLSAEYRLLLLLLLLQTATTITTTAACSSSTCCTARTA